MMELFVSARYLIFLFVLFLNSIVFCDNSNCSSGQCSPKDYIIVATLDGSITALDLDSGIQLWSTMLDLEKFVSSSLSKLEAYESDNRFFLVPSLDGNLFKYDSIKKIITSLPLNVETLINRPGYLDPINVITGGKMKILHGVHRITGEVLYTCSTNGCTNFKTPFPDNMIVIEEIVQIINAIDSGKAEKRWHFRVVELKIRIALNENIQSSSITSNKTSLIPTVKPRVKDFINVDSYKISLENGFAGKLNKRKNEFSWIFKPTAPISDAWIVADDLVELLDPFDKESSFYSIDVDDGQYSALLYLGTYEDENFVKQLRKVPVKYSETTALSLNLLYRPIVIPACSNERNLSGPHSETGVLDALMLHHENYTDHGFYFYANISFEENSTHCFIKAVYMQTNERVLTTIDKLAIWLSVLLIGFFFSLSCYLIVIFGPEVTKPIASKSTCTVEVSVSDDNKEEFISRFHDDFVLISVLGKGGFGIVMDVENKVDGCHYAVKRICLHKELDNFQYDKVLREVKALATLDHHGIVRYFNAWFEYPPAGWQEKMDKESNIGDISLSSSYEEETKPRIDLRSKKCFHINALSKKKSTKPAILKNRNLNPCDIHSSSSAYTLSNKKSAKLSVLKKLNQNPLQLFNDDLFAANVSFEESKQSEYSFSNENSCSSKSLEEISDIEFSNAQRLGLNTFTYDTSDSDSSVLFEDNENESISNKSSSTKFWINAENELIISHAQEGDLPRGISKKHASCYKNLKLLNESLVYPVSLEMLYLFSGTILADSITNASNWTTIVSLLTTKDLCFYEKWTICILCKLSSKGFPCPVATKNLCVILADLNKKLHEKYLSNARMDFSCGYLYIQMQLCQKESLRDWLDKNTDFRVYEKSLKIFSEIVDAVHYVHGCGLMHRDLKPSNIYFSLEGAIKIGDFGLATSTGIKVENEPSYQPSNIHTSDIGTELYMSPEQKLEKDYDFKTDIYSLGIIFFELLVPFKTHLERGKVLSGVRKSCFPKDFKKKFQVECDLLKRLLNDEPNERPTTSDIKQHPVFRKLMSTLK